MTVDGKSGRWSLLLTGLTSAHNNASLGMVEGGCGASLVELFLSPEDHLRKWLRLRGIIVGTVGVGYKNEVSCASVMGGRGERESRVGASLAAKALGGFLVIDRHLVKTLNALRP